MPILAILVAHEHRAYREALAAALPLLRAGVRAYTCPPEDLDAALPRLVPDLVIASDLSPAVQRLAHNWVVLHPNGAPESVVCVGGAWETNPAPDFADILRVIDRARASLDAAPAWG